MYYLGLDVGGTKIAAVVIDASGNERGHRTKTIKDNPIWPELETTLKAHGAHRYAIWLDPGRHLLFASVEIESEARWNAIAGTEVCKRWWKHMREVMPVNTDDSPVSVELKPVFYYAD